MFDLLGCELAWRPELGTFAPLLGGDASASIQDIRAAGDCAGVTEEVCCGSRSRYRLRCRGRLELASRRHRCGAAGSVRHRVRDESSEGFGLSRISLNELVQFVARGRGELADPTGLELSRVRGLVADRAQQAGWVPWSATEEANGFKRAGVPS
jgi:hypothetical protein